MTVTGVQDPPVAGPGPEVRASASEPSRPRLAAVRLVGRRVGGYLGRYLGRLTGRRADLAVAVVYLVGAVYVAGHLLRDPSNRVQEHNAADNVVFQWALAHGARLLTHGGNPFFSTALNMPDGVNLIANTSILGLALPLAPVTLLFGPAISYALLVILAPFSTALSWYFVLSRHVVGARTAAALGGLFCGFAPGMISQDTGHPNIAMQFLIPLIIWRAIRLREPGKAVRNGIILGLLCVWQAFINEEILLITVVGFGLFLAGYAVRRRGVVAAHYRTFLAGAGVAAVVGVLALAYPLYVQFLGPQHYRGLPNTVEFYGTDLASFFAFSSVSIGGRAANLGHLAQNAAEENSFFGWPLVVLVLAVGWWLRRNPVVFAASVVGFVFAVLSMGPRLTIRGAHAGLPGPFALLAKLPLFDTMVPTRLALGVIPAVGVLLAVGYREIVTLLRQISLPEVRRTALVVWGTLLVAALLPLVPRPLDAINAPPMPGFISSGAWRAYVAPGHSLVPVPLPSSSYAYPMAWSAVTGLDLAIPRGYFLGPKSDSQHPGNLQAVFGAPPRPTPTLLAAVASSSTPAVVSAYDRTEFLADLRFWHASVVVLAPQFSEEALWKTTTDLVGFTPTWTDGLWVWDVRALVG